MTSIPAALLLVAAVALGRWLDSHPWRRPARLYWGGPPTLADCLQPTRKRGVRRG